MFALISGKSELSAQKTVRTLLHKIDFFQSSSQSKQTVKSEMHYKTKSLKFLFPRFLDAKRMSSLMSQRESKLWFWKSQKTLCFKLLLKSYFQTLQNIQIYKYNSLNLLMVKQLHSFQVELIDITQVQYILYSHMLSLNHGHTEQLIHYFYLTNVFTSVSSSSHEGQIRQMIRIIIPQMKITYPMGGYFNQVIDKNYLLIPLKVPQDKMISFQILIQRAAIKEAVKKNRINLVSIKKALFMNIEGQYGYKWKLRYDLDYLFKEGQISQHIFIVLAGSIYLISDKCKFLQITSMGIAGDLEEYGQPRKYSARAKKGSSIIIINKTQISNLNLKTIGKQEKCKLFRRLLQRYRQKKSKIFVLNYKDQTTAQSEQQLFSDVYVKPYGCKSRKSLENLLQIPLFPILNYKEKSKKDIKINLVNKQIPNLITRISSSKSICNGQGERQYAQQLLRRSQVPKSLKTQRVRSKSSALIGLFKRSKASQLAQN